MSEARPRITVIGSLNVDLVVRCPRLPRPGETVLADSSAEFFGGKGANQAVAAARAGADVAMVGRVGDDAFADRLIANLREEGIDCDGVLRTEGCSSGLAVVAVAADAQNSIMVVPGANGRVTAQDVQVARSRIESSDVVLLQLEVSVMAVEAAIEIARAAKVRVILDPAPARSELPTQLFHVDLLCPNESEAAALTGLPVTTVEQATMASRKLHAMGARNVVVTLGDRGTMFFDGCRTRLIAPFPTAAVDTTAAGDAFAGAVAARWSECQDLEEAIRFANAAGALAASREGAQVSMPAREEIERLVRART